MDTHARGQFPFHEPIPYSDFEDYERAVGNTYSRKAIKVVLRWKSR
jgi:hypothetical protein